MDEVLIHVRFMVMVIVDVETDDDDDLYKMTRCTTR